MLNSILFLQLLLLLTTETSARRHVSVMGSSSRRLSLSSFGQGILEQLNENLDETYSYSSDILDTTILDLRGGAKRGGNRKARTATLSSKKSSSTATSATGAKKVGAAAAAKKEEKNGSLAGVRRLLEKMQPITRVYLILIMLTTLLGLILGEENAQAALALDPTRLLRGWELWRPLTAATFFGKPTISFVFSIYFINEYGSSLEKSYGSAQFLVFFLTEIVILTVMSALLGQPFFAQSIITSMLHCLSRSSPHQNAKWLVFTVPFWTLPYGLMVTDVLQTQQPMAVIPHVMGILAGHFYFFHKFVWPKKRGGVDWLVPPSGLAKRMDPNAAKKKAFAEALAKKMKSKKGRPRKGRKLSDK